MPITPKRMPEAELERLGDLLERRAVAHGGMDLELLDGFLSALALAPEREPPAAEEWFAHLWGKTEPRWESAADRADAVGLAEALLGDLLARFGYGGDDPQGPMPMASMDEGGAEPGADAPPLASGWACGFLEGVALRAGAWEGWAGESALVAESLERITALAGEEAQAEPAADAAPRATPLRHDERLAELEELPYVLHALFVERIERLTPRVPLKREDRPGPNDPCSCGSGRKFKKCCGKPG
jgi:uncharacterized protein